MKRIHPLGVLTLVFALGLPAARSVALNLPSAEDVAVRIAAVGGADDYKGADWVTVLDHSEVTVRDSGLATTEQCVIVKLLTEAGAREWAVQRFSFDPNANRIEILKARIHRADGLVDEVPLDDIVVKPAPEGIIFWGGKHKLLALPALAVGDAVELVTSKTGFNVAYLSSGGDAADGGETLQPPMPGHWYDIVQFDDSKPIIEKRYTVRIAREKTLNYEVYNGALGSSLRVDGDHNVYSWWRTDVPAFEREPMMVAFDDVACKLVLATVTDWEDKSRWFFEANEEQFEINEEMQALVDRVVRDHPDPKEQWRILNHWVAENIRYVGNSRGPKEGYTVHKAIETWRDRGGVCKDKAGILCALLRAAGHDAYVAMTMAGSRVEEVAADQFNHCVTTVKQEDGTFVMLDPTWSPKSRELWSSREQLQHIVRGLPDGRPLEITEYSDPAENHLTVKAESAIDAEGTLTTRIDGDTLGYPETSVRRWLDRYHPDDRRGAIAAEMQRVSPAISLASATVTDPVDFTQAAVFSIEMSAVGYGAGDDDLRIICLPLMRHPLGDVAFSDLLSAEATRLKERKYPLRMRSTRLVRYAETIRLPDGWHAANLPPAKAVDGPAAAMNFEITAGEGTIEYTFEFILKKHHVPPSEYAGFCDAVKAMNDIADHRIVIAADGKATELAANAATELEETR